MDTTTVVNFSGFSRLKLFFALSRTPHGLLDMATPAVGALLWLGGIPPFHVVALGLLTAFAGYTAVYALNDVVDYRVDREKVHQCGLPQAGNDLDALCARHPLAQGFLSLKEGIAWTVSWAMVALLGAYALNPVSALIFIMGCLAEAIYCLMLRISYLRTIVSGAVKTAGGLAAVFAVTQDPSLSFVLLFFLWLFFWEIGGQNVPNDWADMKEDRDLSAETIPVRFGVQWAAKIIVLSNSVAIFLSMILFWATPATLSPLYLPGALAVGVFLLIIPGYRLYRTKAVEQASILFNRASYYPACMLLVILISSRG